MKTASSYLNLMCVGFMVVGCNPGPDGHADADATAEGSHVAMQGDGAEAAGGHSATDDAGPGATGGYRDDVGLGATGGYRDDVGLGATGGYRDDGAGPGVFGGHAAANDGSYDVGALRDASPDVPIVVDEVAPVRMAIPLYVWPGDATEWARVAAAGKAVSYIIANAGDPGGPGPSPDAAYTEAIANAHDNGQRVIGYVDTSYATRDRETVESEINAWYAFYPSIDGIFLDLSPASADRIPDYYRPASELIRTKPGDHIVIMNPGQPHFDEAYMAYADVMMSYENPFDSPDNGYTANAYSAPSWVNRYDARRFWHVILEVSDKTAMQKTLALASSRNVGHVYITNHPDPPAYARLPAFFAEEVEAVRGLRNGRD